MKLAVSLLSLGLVAADPRCGITCVDPNAACARNTRYFTPSKTPGSYGPNGRNSGYSKKKSGDGPDSRMIGVQASAGMFPWMAGIRLPNGKICGGSIINSKTVLTAASCFTNENSRRINNYRGAKVYVGFPEGLPHESVEHDMISSAAKSMGQGIHEIQQVKLHRRYKGKMPEEYDAAILVLKSKIVYSQAVKNERLTYENTANGTSVSSDQYSWTRPACFAKRAFQNNYVAKTSIDGESSVTCMASGYGKDAKGQMGKLNFGNMKALETDTCKNKLNTEEKSPFKKANIFLKNLPRSYMCAQGVEARDKSITQGRIEAGCEGDTGAPLVCYPVVPGAATAQIIQAGISSMGLTCGAPKVPGIYTSLAGISGWVYSTAKPYGTCQFRNAPDEQ